MFENPKHCYLKEDDFTYRNDIGSESPPFGDGVLGIAAHKIIRRLFFGYRNFIRHLELRGEISFDPKNREVEFHTVPGTE